MSPSLVRPGRHQDRRRERDNILIRSPFLKMVFKDRAAPARASAMPAGSLITAISRMSLRLEPQHNPGIT